MEADFNGEYLIKTVLCRITCLFICMICACCLAGCGNFASEEKLQTCNVVLEQGEGFFAEHDVCTVNRGEDAEFNILVEDGYQILAADCEDYSLEYTGNGTALRLVAHEVRYPMVISLTVKKSDFSICYYANGGRCIDRNSTDMVEIPVMQSHLRINTSIGIDMFVREGYTQIGWNTKADGSGIAVGLGSRVWPEESAELYAVWVPWTNADCFEYERSGKYAVITDYWGDDTIVSIPGELDGYPVIGIEENAFLDTSCEIVIFPQSIQRVEDGAFRNAGLRELYLSDNISYINDSCFDGCGNLQTLHINAAEAPVYSGNYFDTFQDKYDYLLSVKDCRKIVLFSGSSTRFGYDSERLKEEFSDYEIVNMGVFAYTNALPQFILIEEAMQEGDILIHAPEFDARQRQFCTTNALDDEFFCMMESNYDTVAVLDLRMFSQVFNSFYSYLNTRRGMEPKSYRLAAKNFDEDGKPVEEESYNQYGDYILYRPNADSEEPIYGLPVEYTVASFPKENYFDKANEIYQRFLAQGVQVYFTYAPRNKYAISDDSTEEARAELHNYLKEELIIPVISDIEESLYPGTYLYGTDNHLSTEGVKIRTEQIIADLRRQMDGTGGSR
ncbi:MAG: leucine-rich repeat domain-containing protein [Lachnospiraceae bacterium]|nr:leucine-rich repeat domain-containing protein [Lachnospiraceae bacterium]